MMHSIIRLLMIFLILGIVPYICGYLFRDIIKDMGKIRQICFQYVCGFFVMMALFSVVCVPAIYMGMKFHIFVIVYNILLGILVCISLYQMVRAGYKTKSEEKKHYKIQDFLHLLNQYEWIYLAIFVFLVAIQLYATLRYTSSYNSLDDATYIAYAQDALDTDMMLQHAPYTGYYQNIDLHRAFQTSLIYNAYLSKMTEISVTTMVHTVLALALVVMAYMVYYLIASQLFEKKENQFIFLGFIALLYMWGNYSHYSLSFRLLGVIWQGKAILAVVLIPLLFVIMYELLHENYNYRYGVLLMILSITATSLTLIGAGAFLFIIMAVGILEKLHGGQRKKLLYSLWGCVVPVVVACAYLFDHIA